MRSATLTALVLLVGQPSIAQEPSPSGSVTVHSVRLAEDVAPILTGKIVDAQNGNPVFSVQVFLEGTDIGSLSDRNGGFQLEGIEPGTWILGMRLIGYEAESVELQLEAGTVTQVLAGMRRARLDDGPFLFIPPGEPRPPPTDTLSAPRGRW